MKWHTYIMMLKPLKLTDQGKSHNDQSQLESGMIVRTADAVKDNVSKLDKTDKLKWYWKIIMDNDTVRGTQEENVDNQVNVDIFVVNIIIIMTLKYFS